MTTTSPDPDRTGVTHVELRPGAYADSVTLLQVSRDVAGTPGVLAAQVAMATPLNLEVLESMGFDIPESTANDMVVALRLEEESHRDAALAAVEGALAAASTSRPGEAEQEQPPRTTATALRGSSSSLAFVSVPGANALVEAMDALDADRDVMIFSDNVPVDQEVALKRVATERDLLVMGPDCGTAMVGGVGLGFANATSPGPVGIVAASGTGCQQLMCLLDHAGVGVGAALGVGGRDLSSDVGGASTRTALSRLDADPSISEIVVISKPPAPEVAEDLRAHAGRLGTRVHFALLSPESPDLTRATEEVLTAMGTPVPTWPSWGQAEPGPGGLVRGLFSGGTLCDEAMLLASADLGGIRSNIPLSADLAVGTDLRADGQHLMVDFGDDALTRGRAHPMIDPMLRLEHLDRMAADPETGVLLLDVVLGHGADPDPAGSLADAIAAARARRGVPVVVSLVGTESDPQGLTRQARALAEAGAEVHLSNAAATRRAVALCTGGTAR